MRYLIYFATIAGLFLWLKADAKAAELAGPGPFLIINDNKAVVGTVQDGVAVALEGAKSGTPFATKDNPVTFRLQTQQLAKEPRSWNPEPAKCPRGIKVLRYGSWGC